MVKLLDIIKAKDNIKNVIRETPLVYSPVLSDYGKGSVYLKLECHQKTGSFKLRGAANKMKSLSTEEKEKGVITASAGNHAQGVAFIARELGVDATIIIPENAPLTKIENTKRYGVNVVVEGKDYDESEKIAHLIEKEKDKTFVHPYSDPFTIAGQGTVGLEMIMSNPELDTIIVPAGGGGLITGIATAAKAINPNIRIIGVQPENSPVWYESFKNKKHMDVEYSDSLADGLVGEISESMVDDFVKLVDEVVLVSEDAIRNSIKWLMENHHIIAEGSSVVGLAAIQEEKINIEGKNVGIVISGSNIDLQVIAEILGGGK
jgi:threonine dehydratase